MEQDQKDLFCLLEEEGERLKELSDKIQKEWKLLKQERNAIDEEKEKMKQMAKLAKSKIVLNVGGKRFEVSKDTLMNRKDSFFYSMLHSDQFPPDENNVRG